MKILIAEDEKAMSDAPCGGAETFRLRGGRRL